MADSLKEILVGIFKRDYVDDTTLSNRKKECDKCEYQSLGQCLECNCLLIAKQKLVNEQCPLGRW